MDDLLEHAFSYLKLKDVPRTGWILRGVTKPESVAAHSWGTAILCRIFLDRALEHDGPLDVRRVLEIALVHDLAEVTVGDIPRRVSGDAQPVSDEEKRRREFAAIGGLTEHVPGIRALWTEYEEAATPEARFVRDMNLIDMCLQALYYERYRRYDPAVGVAAFPDYDAMDEFFATSAPRIATKIGQSLHGEIKRQYLRERGQAGNVIS